MKFFGTVIFILIAFFAVIALVVLFYIRKGIIFFKRHLTGDYDDETFQRMANKYYRGNGEGPQFDKDYFKGTGGYHKGAAGPRSQGQQQARTTVVNHEGENVTIIDDRSTVERKKKIFTQDEGEYVDYVEES